MSDSDLTPWYQYPVNLIKDTSLDVVERFRLLPKWLQRLIVAGSAIGAAGALCYPLYKEFDYLYDDYLIISRAVRIKDLAQIDGMIYSAVTRIEKLAVQKADKTALLYLDQAFTYSEMNRQINKHSHALMTAGISPGSTTAILMKNKPEFLFLFFGLMKIGCVSGLMNFNIKGKALVHCLKESNARHLIVDNDTELIAAVGEISNELNNMSIEVILYSDNSDSYKVLLPVLERADDSNINKELRETKDFQARATYIFTSGTTGLPKAAIITYMKLFKMAAMMTIMNCDENTVMYSPLPLYHSSGLGLAVNSTIFNGGTVAIAPKFSVSRYWKDCVRYKATVIVYIGELCRYLLTGKPSQEEKQHRIRTAVGNGLRKDIWVEFKTRFNIPNIAEFYGATEGTRGFMNLTNKVGSVGRHSPYMDKRDPCVFIEYDHDRNEIVRDRETGLCVPVKIGKPGLLLTTISQASMYDGYTSKQQSESKIIRNVLREGDSYFNTGDILLRDVDYYLYFVDRVGDTFRWKGENVSTQEVDAAIVELPSLTDCSSFGVGIPHCDGKGCMTALVLNSGALVNEEFLSSFHKHCDDVLPRYACPLFIRIVTEMTMTSTFKHQKAKLREEGYNTALKQSQFYVFDLSAQRYVTLTDEIYQKIQNGQYRF